MHRHNAHFLISIYIGRFETPEEAARAYNKKAIELYGEYAKLNVVADVVA